MKYAGIIYDDFSAAPGVSLTFFVQGCPHHCEGCHNPETWSFEDGEDVPFDIVEKICDNINARGVHRNLCIMGGEPLCEENLFLTDIIVSEVRNRMPEQEIYLWTGYYYDDLLKSSNKRLIHILDNINYLIDGPYVKELRDIRLPMRGSSNQNIIKMDKN